MASTASSFLSRLNDHPFALLFAGQSNPWQPLLAEQDQDPSLSTALRDLVAETRDILAPVAAELTSAGAGLPDVDRFLSAADAIDPAVSVPGITLSQYGQLTALFSQFDATRRPALLGHSQGILGVAVAEAMLDERAELTAAQALAVACLIGAATSRASRSYTANTAKTTNTTNTTNTANRGAENVPMIALSGCTPQVIERILDAADSSAAIALRNGRDRFVVSGTPADLERVRRAAADAMAADKAELAAKTRGGQPLTIEIAPLEVSAPFHHPLLEHGVHTTVAWAKKCGIGGVAEKLARGVMTDRIDWPAQVNAVIDEGVEWFVDLGPGEIVGVLTADIAEGAAGVVPAHNLTEIDRLGALGQEQTWVNWADFQPRVVEVNGTKTVETAFTRLTGNSPILLAGMTPTTVDPEIVAAAANAGYWAELAGGGQVTAEVFDQNLTKLKSQLEPGRACQFNAMFMDRYLWNLQFGGQRIVSKARQSGAPINGVVISAGIPELDEAPELITELHEQGFEYVAFKPGTVAQIRQCLAIAEAVDSAIILHVEDGHAGGHHSWENLDDLLLATYGDIRRHPNVVLCVGGGIGSPERAADYVSGQWSAVHGMRPMPVDGVLIGTAAMTAKEAKTTEAVKDLLVATNGLGDTDSVDEPGAVDGSVDGTGWVGSGASVGGVTSGLSHLRADMHEIDNSAAACARLIAEVEGDSQRVAARRDEIIAALNKTAKPFFGELGEMTYEQVVRRFAELSYPWVDGSWSLRYWELLQRVEARLSDADHGEVETLFPSAADAEDAHAAADTLLQHYPAAAELTLTPLDVAWFVALCRKYPKPMGFVPVIDDDLLRWWGQDSLWQAQDDRYPADAVRVIPGPVAVAGIKTKNEPIATILGRFEDAVVKRVAGEAEKASEHATENTTENAGEHAVSRLASAATIEDYLTAVPFISWTGHIMDNPAHILDSERFTLTIEDTKDIKNTESTARPSAATLTIHLDTFWDGSNADVHAVHELVVPLLLPESIATGGLPVVDESRLPESMFSLLAGTAGVGNVGVTGDKIDHLPSMESSDRSEFGEAHYSFHVSENLGPDHTAATGAALPGTPGGMVPDALLGPCWPAIYAALGSAQVEGYPVIEGLLNAVHLDHTVDFGSVPSLPAGTRVDVTSWASAVEESSSGRVVQVNLVLSADGEEFGRFTERFAIRGRVFGSTPPADPPFAGNTDRDVVDTPRSTLSRVLVTAPADMTQFAWVSGDFNPIHTSHAAARVAGLEAPLVHGMWLSATAQHAVAQLGYRLTGWTYRMFGLVDLNTEVEIQVERIARLGGGGVVLEVTCRIDGELVSQATATTDVPVTAYAYPGQGIQSKGMGLSERTSSRATAEVWERADAHTREALGFSILAIVRDNPTEISANGQVYRHPDGVLYLTQFTQVALATLAFAQTARLRESGALARDAYFAGHSLGEYNALSAYAQTIDLETVLELVFHRGSTMHNLVPRDERGRSNYRMGALRPHKLGVDENHVAEYVAEVASETGEFLEIVNYNLAGQQYAVAGTVAGIKALEKHANARAAEVTGGKAFMLVPGIDVPFHSAVLHDGVPDFRERLNELLPEEFDYEVLEGRYIPNLVARPFELTREFAQSILDVVPSEAVRDALEHWDEWQPSELARLLLVELLCWQFASPVRWIETQALLFSSEDRGGVAVEDFVEIGLGAAPTLANLAAKTLGLSRFADSEVRVLNVQRDEKRVYAEDVQTIELDEADPESGSGDGVQALAGGAGGAGGASGASSAEVDPENGPAANPAPLAEAHPSPAAGVQPGGVTDAPDLPYKASDAIRTLLAFANKLRPEQVGDADTTGSLTNGVSSRLNQLLMDMSAELGLSSVEGAAEADVATLSATVDKAAFNYKPFGPVLGEAIKDRVRKLFGAAGAKQSFIAEHVSSEWGLGDGWAAHTTAQILLGSREGTSARGGELATLPDQAASMAAVKELIDEAVAQVGAAHGIPVAKPTTGGGGAVVDSAALDGFAETITGPTGVLASTARHVLDVLGLDTPEAADFDHSEQEDTDRILAAVSAELGSSWPSLVAPSFDAARAVLLDDRWASAREDIARIALGELRLVDGGADAASGVDGVALSSFVGAGAAVAAHARWWADNLGSESHDDANGDGHAQAHAEVHAKADEKRDALLRIAEAAEAAEAAGAAGAQEAENAADGATDLSGTVAVVTGMAPTSIAGAVVADLLSRGATVVATASRVSPSRLAYAKQLYRTHARPGAALWLVPANLASFRDVDALVEWIGSEQSETVGSERKLIKPALVPDLFFPFAAPPVMGSVEDAGAAAEHQTRLLLWSVERSMTALAKIGADTDVAHRLHVVLPGSPNRGTFGGDGAYGETKAAFDAIVNKWSVEPWAKRITLAHPRIGWVAGTGLMGGNDPLVAAAKDKGIRVWTPEEIAAELMDLCTDSAREQARTTPIEADLTGGLEGFSLTSLDAPEEGSVVASEEEKATIQALPTPAQQHQPAMSWGNTTAELDETVVIVGIGEVSAWGSGRTRCEAEYGIHADTTVDLTAAGVLELAWMTGLLTWKDTPKAGWYDQDDNMVDEADIFERYRDEVIARAGVRTFVADGAIETDDADAAGTSVPNSPLSVEMFLDRDVTFTVDSEDDAQRYVQADPQFTRAEQVGDEWRITRLAGGRARVPRRATLARKVGGQFPTDFDPARWGIPADMVESLDRMAVWNLVTTVDAFLSAGFSPAEILQAVHPSDVAMTQGTGFGGMTSMRKLFVDRFLNEDIPSDILQETLPNVVAAHTMQSFVGGYGAMIHPVGACATAAVSVEEGLDKIACGKADFVVAGAVDDISVESISGFASMNATADSDAMAAKGINERFYSRANDRRRAGFVEAQGGGTVLLARGSVAAKLGLPVYGVVAYAQSFADGMHTSIPAPGQGALAAARGGRDSRLVRALDRLGVDADDIAVVSKHDTSTNANDPNESRLHTRLGSAMGRAQGNPLFVVSQKTLTGHAKGGAAVFQIAGLCDMFRTGRIPANASLDCVDPEMAVAENFVWLRSPIQLPQIRAGLLTSLGFGHVSALVALVHPGAFFAVVERCLGSDAATSWQQRATERLRAGVARREAGMLGHAPLFARLEGRRFAEDAGAGAGAGDGSGAGAGQHRTEAEMLLDPEARLGQDGLY